AASDLDAQDEEREEDLEAETPEDRPRLDGAPVRREQPAEREDGEETEDAPEAIQRSPFLELSLERGEGLLQPPLLARAFVLLQERRAARSEPLLRGIFRATRARLRAAARGPEARSGKEAVREARSRHPLQVPVCQRVGLDR